MDAYIPLYKIKTLIQNEIGCELMEYNLVFKNYKDNTCVYMNNHVTVEIFYYHKEVGVRITLEDKRIINSSDLVDICNRNLLIPRDESCFSRIEDYFQHLLQVEFDNIKKCVPNIFYGNI